MFTGRTSNYCKYPNFSNSKTHAIVQITHDLLSCLPLQCACHSSTLKPQFLYKSLFTKCWEHNITNGVSGWVRRVHLGKIVMFKGLCAKHHTGNSKEGYTLILTQEAEPTSWSIIEEHYSHFLLLRMIFSYYQVKCWESYRYQIQCRNRQVYRCSLCHILL